VSAAARVHASHVELDGEPDIALAHDEATDANIGWGIEPEDWARAKKRRAELEDQTAQLADLLEEAGVETRLRDENVVSISAITGIVTPIATWRPIRFLPAVAARDRRPMLNGLRYWCDHVAGYPQYLRYAVVTSGDLIPAHGDLRPALQGLARRVSKWAKAARETYGVVVHFRGTEYTRKTAAERGLDDRFPADLPLYHPHGNILYEPTRKLADEGPGSWAEFLSWTREELGAHWKDNGRVADVREIVKYVVKPADLLDGEKPIDPAEAKWLHESMFRLNLAQPLGEFRTWWRDVAEAKLKVVRIRQGSGGALRLVRKAGRFDHSGGREDAEPGPKPANLFIGMTMPQWQHTPWAEPMLIVQNYQPNACGTAAIERLREISFERMVARDVWDRSGAPAPSVALQMAKTWLSSDGHNVAPLRPARAAPYRVHTCSLTVPLGKDAEGSLHPPPDPPPKGRVLAFSPRSTPSTSSDQVRSGSA
jgi:hypothetical protein